MTRAARTGVVDGVAAPSVTIAPRNPAKGILNFVVTLTTHKDVSSYPCRSMESAIKLVQRFIAGVTKPARPTAPGQSVSDPSTLNPQPTQRPKSDLPGARPGIFSAREPGPPIPIGTPCYGLEPFHEPKPTQATSPRLLTADYRPFSFSAFQPAAPFG